MLWTTVSLLKQPETEHAAEPDHHGDHSALFFPIALFGYAFFAAVHMVNNHFHHTLLGVVLAMVAGV